jgi:type I restriction enzyme S subunit
VTSAGWPSLPLKRVVDSVQSGTSVNGAPWPALDDQLGVLKTSAVYGGVFTPTENKEVESYDRGRVSCPVLAGSLIVSRMNTPQHLGVAALVSQDFPNLYLPDRLWAVTFSGAEPRFVDWWTKTTAYRAQVEAVSVGTSSSMQNISQGDFLEIRIELPDLETQRAIADYINRETARIDTLIEEQQRLIEMLRERRHSVLAHALSGGGPRVPFVRCMTEQVDYRGATPRKTDDGVQLVTARNVKAGWIDYETSQEFVDPAEYAEIMHRGLPRIGDLLFTMEAPLGNVAVVDREDIALAQRVIKWSVDRSKAEPRFLMYAALGDDFQEQLLARATGSTALGVKASKLPELRIDLPSLEEQRSIIICLDEQTAKIDTLMTETEGFIELSRERRSALITAAVTGQVDVREMV